MFRVAFELGDPTATKWESVDAWVDSGSTFTWVSQQILERLGVIATERMQFDTATGDVIERPVGEAPVRLMGETHMTTVVFAEDSAPPLLGAFTLERFLLGVDPVNQRLIPVRALAL